MPDDLGDLVACGLFRTAGRVALAVGFRADTVLVGVAAIALGLDTGILTRFSTNQQTYTQPKPDFDERGLDGTWTVSGESARIDAQGGTIVYRCHARDLHLVPGPGKDGRPVRFKMTIDGAAPGQNHSVDVASDGTGMVGDQRPYQLVRQKGSIADHTFAIEFLDHGVNAFALHSVEQMLPKGTPVRRHSTY